MKKRDYLKHLPRISYDVLIALISSFVLHGIKVLVPIIVLWLSLLFSDDMTRDMPDYGIHMVAQNVDVSDTG